MRAVILIFIFSAMANHYWEGYKSDKVDVNLVKFERDYGPGICELRNVFVGVECRTLTQSEITNQRKKREDEESLQRWNDRMADAEARKLVAQQVEDLIHYGQ
ncbi:hypothetical protein [Pseudomonas sp.]|uniref:hypothetical protein n=1 Tax=Pseudomonas sp. TaxID=306 RepID=UPI002FC722A0